VSGREFVLDCVKMYKMYTNIIVSRVKWRWKSRKWLCMCVCVRACVRVCG